MFWHMLKISVLGPGEDLWTRNPRTVSNWRVVFTTFTLQYNPLNDLPRGHEGGPKGQVNLGEHFIQFFRAKCLSIFDIKPFGSGGVLPEIPVPVDLHQSERLPSGVWDFILWPNCFLQKSASLTLFHPFKHTKTPPDSSTNENATLRLSARLENGWFFFLGLIFFGWGTFPCYLLHFGAKTCTLLRFGAKFCHLHCSSIFPWCSLIYPKFSSIFP